MFAATTLKTLLTVKLSRFKYRAKDPFLLVLFVSALVIPPGMAFFVKDRLNDLETIFWLTALASTFFSFKCVDILFRDNAYANPLPIAPSARFAEKILTLLFPVSLSSVVIALFCLPAIATDIRLYLAQIALWTLGLSFTVIISCATLLFSASSSVNMQSSPAVALGISLVLLLILKLGLESAIVTFDAGAKASLIICSSSAVSALLYAYRVFIEKFHVIQASFNEKDGIVINENYDFIGNGISDKLFAKEGMVSALCLKNLTLFRRFYPSVQLLFPAASFILAVVLLYQDDLFTPGLFTLAPASILLFAFPWERLRNPKLESPLALVLPIPPRYTRRAAFVTGMRLSLSLSFPVALAVSLASLKYLTLPLSIAVFVAAMVSTLIFAWPTQKLYAYFPGPVSVLSKVFAVALLFSGRLFSNFL